MRPILVAYDGSEGAKRALEEAASGQTATR